MMRPGTIPQASANPNTTQNPMPNVPLVTNNPHPTFQRQPPNKRRPKAISIIDPDTGQSCNFIKLSLINNCRRKSYIK